MTDTHTECISPTINRSTALIMSLLHYKIGSSWQKLLCHVLSSTHQFSLGFQSNAFEMVNLILFVLTIFQHRGSSYHVFKFNGSISSSSSPSYATLSSKVEVKLPDQMVLCTSSQQARLADYLTLQSWEEKCENVKMSGLTTGQSTQFSGEMADHGSILSSG